VKSKYFNFEQEANLTPTALGLELFARCQGHRGAPHDYYAAQPESLEKSGSKEDSAPQT
jgi:hypothetical protein